MQRQEGRQIQVFVNDELLHVGDDEDNEQTGPVKTWFGIDIVTVRFRQRASFKDLGR